MAAVKTNQSTQRRAADNKAPADEHIQALKKQYPKELSTLKELFSEWSEADLLATLEEVEGDMNLAYSRIAEGHAEQWGEVKKRERKDKPKSAAPDADGFGGGARAGRGGKQFDATRTSRGGTFAGRGGRGGGRGGRGGGRGGSMVGSYRGAPSNGGTSAPSASWGNSEPSASWGNSDAKVDDSAGWGAETNDTPSAAQDTTAEDTTSGGWGDSAPASNGWGDSAQASAPSSWEPKKPAEKAIAAQQKRASAAKADTKPATKVNDAPRAPAAKPKSWAALVKGPEPVPAPVPVPESKPAPVKAGAPAASKDSDANAARAASPVRAPSPAKSPVKETPRAESVKTPEPIAKSPAQPAQPATKPISRPASPPKAAQPPKVEAKEEPVEHTATGKSAPPGFKQAPKAAPGGGRKLKQDAAVVMPSNASLSSIGMQFGSLRLGAGLDGEEEEKETAAPSAPAQQKHAAKPAHHESASATPSSNTQHAIGVTPSVGSLGQNAHQSQHQHQLPQQQQSQTSGQHAARDSRLQGGAAAPSGAPGLQSGLHAGGLAKQADQNSIGLGASTQGAAGGVPNGVAAPYGSYFPTQQLAASQYGLGHIPSLPGDYSALYGNDAQARAMQMHSYYDPNAYQQAAPTKYQSQDVSASQQAGQAGQASPSAAQLQQGQQQPQQGYPPLYPYYPYYHMNQFPSYQGSPYAQPFMNKSVYPGYPQQSQQPSTATTSTPKAQNSSSGYGYSVGGQQHSQAQHQGQHQPHLYQQGSYDDLTTGLGGSHDYKGAYGGGGGAPQQSFQNFGLHQGGIQGVGSQGKVSGAAQVNPAGGQTEYSKSSQGNRPPRQSYDSHKYTAPNGGSSTQQQGSSGANASGASSGPGSYYNQQHLAGLHSQQQQQGANPYVQQMQQQHHQYQNSYGQGRQQQQGQYWSGQS